MTLKLLHTVAAICLLATSAPAQEATPPAQDTGPRLTRFSEDPDRFTQTDGEALYRTTCQACHMEDAKGAMGAGAHPPLAGNPKMRSKHFLAGVILTGYHGMPRFGHMMSDEQVASVTNYVRSNFGHDYPDTMTAAEVAGLRPPEDSD